MDASGSRTTHAQAILGPELSARLPQLRVLLVGAGGIGCELLKNLVLTGFGHITLLDLDTIDLSNLNRQFLFRKKDVKSSKAIVAAATAGAFNPSVKITPIHANIKEPQYDVLWFQSFDLVLNALDNLDARRHVNRLCMAANVPLMESGTAGYLGQVQPLLKGVTECFDCVPKPTPKTFPVCTIRSTPSLPIHCIVWAKSYLFSQLFGEDEDATGQAELDAAQASGENADEIAKLRAEQSAFTAVRTRLRSTSNIDDAQAAQAAFEKVFDADIRNLLSMSDMWRTRAPPTPLDFSKIRAGAFVLTPSGKAKSNGTAGLTTPGPKGSSATEALLQNGDKRVDTAKLKDQKVLSLEQTLELFVDSTSRLAARLRAGETTIAFDKDDPDTLSFVAAASNLRSFAYGIPPRSLWEVKETAGNIIPAIATTNAIIAGLVVLQALHLLRRKESEVGMGKLRSVHAQVKPSQPLLAALLSTPNKACGVCNDTFVTLRIDPSRATFRQVLKVALGDGTQGGGGTGERDVSVFEGARMLVEPDWDDNLDRTLGELGVKNGGFLTITDEEEEWGNLALALCPLPEDHPADAEPFILPQPMPIPHRLPPKPAPAPEVSITPAASGRKRSAPTDEAEDDGIEALDAPPVAKRARTATGTPEPDAMMSAAAPLWSGVGTGTPASPSKKRILEEEGVVLIDTPGEKLDDEDEDVIILD